LTITSATDPAYGEFAIRSRRKAREAELFTPTTFFESTIATVAI
jgi:hypothetical protein